MIAFGDIEPDCRRGFERLVSDKLAVGSMIPARRYLAHSGQLKTCTILAAMRATAGSLSTFVVAVAITVSARIVLPAFAQDTPDCFVVHGRLAVGNGTPSARIWVIGTTRILGIADGPAGNEAAALPTNIRAALSPDPFSKRVFADFQVCPLQPDQPGRMRLVTLKSAKISAVSSVGK